MSFYKHTFSLLFICLVFAINFDLKAQSNVESEIIVKLSEGNNFRSLLNFLSKDRYNEISLERRLSQDEEIYLLKVLPQNRTQIIRVLSREDLFHQVFPNISIEPRKKPNDPKYVNQWTLDKIGLESAWEYTTGGKTAAGDEIVVAVLDDGFFVNHEDLVDRFYSNPFDQPGDMNGDGCPGDCGVDDDGDGLIDEDWLGRQKGDPGYDNTFMLDDDENGYKDDTKGLNPKSNSDIHPSNSHGSSCAGIIGANSNNNTGVSGVNWDVKILPLSGGLNEADVIESYNYIAAMRKQYNDNNGSKGAFIVACNYSLGIDGAEAEDYPIWCDLYDKMGKQGILSAVATTNANSNIDRDGDIPAKCPSSYIIAVTSTDIVDNFAEAGFGKVNIDMAAPGEESYTVAPTKADGYGSFPGTSAATPHVTGAIGLLYSIPCLNFINFFKTNPSKVDSLASIIIDSGDRLESLVGLTKSEKRLNVLNAMITLNGFCGGIEGSVIVNKIYPNPSIDELKIEFNADPTEKIYIEIYNILGQKLIQKELIFPLFESPETTIFTGDLITGLYFLSINQGKKRSALKFYKS